ncbi:MAG: NAD(P)-dependent glycerol-3-phosphate dehydrogenase [Deltaproteobacteria bacterium]|nr:NAD(P)-dependent glycerol-3-phosphate dehydrogenase [Deltaproteobacteria bacterium]
MARPLDILVVGGGSWGTALASILAGLGRKVRLCVRRPEQADEINTLHTNGRYLPGAALPQNLSATADLAGSVAEAAVILVVVPSKHFRTTARAVGERAAGDQIIVHATKGIEIETFKRMSEVLREETSVLKIGVLSGPNLAKEIVAGQPAGALVASRYDEVVRTMKDLFTGPRFRLYGSRDVVGTEIAGSFKNVIALAAGAVDGMGLGNNTKSLLVTRGLSEMARFGVALGADVFTFAGLAGIGDLMVTCVSPLSRNHQVGERVGKGERLDDVLASMPYVAEGVPTTAAIHRQARKMGLELRIVSAVHACIHEGKTAREAITELMSRPAGEELGALVYK